ncbi:N-6 DNA methylase [Limnothrix sp. FACHB-708]|uniref:Eco57I restriction-modification methylase domain-containing protein n=1 Tax=unclassified Limnothrix TaxID=2632864 RepID=UPI0016828683|nr:MULTISPECIES: N-6 DNA methylase [unclassified Limnothrix]MBD2552140.1 N-6 DNA methylase [Limnothrix sp. FACHB-708]MBD2592340.1 N-6 DNA methylase [Limnothrix sp. FACHB-406]
MSLKNFQAEVMRLAGEAEQMQRSPREGKPEDATKSRLLEPLLNALGYTPECRTPEGKIKSLIRTTTWVDYLLKPEAGTRPVLMFEAKSLWDKDIWESNKQQVLDYLRDYSLDIANDQPVLWIVLSNFREWYVLRLQDKTPFWQFKIENLQNDPELGERLYSCLARENLRGDRLTAYYTENTREGLGARFLADLKIWRAILANGIKASQPGLSLDRVREASQVILNRFLLIRLLEAYSSEMPYNYLGRIYYNWQETFPDLPFIEELRKGFRNTWVGYNTELFHPSWVDELDIESNYLEPLIIVNAVPENGLLYAITETLTEYRSIYNYDFTTLTQDILGTAYEQFLAHQLIEDGHQVKILENQQTRKREGVFYTPEYIVRRIVYQTLQPLVETKIDQAIALLQAHHFTEAHAIASSVLEITVCDPACGSGSFLLGAFDYLLDELRRYNKACENPNLTSGNGDLFSHSAAIPISNIEESIVVKMLHGVDLDPQAVLLAKLSLWTRLLRARPNVYGKRKTLNSKLPALALNIRVGNSLIHSPANLEPVSEQLVRAADLAIAARNVTLSEHDRTQAVTNLEHYIAEINQQINPTLAAFFASDESLQEATKLIKNREASDKEVIAIRRYLTSESPRVLQDWTVTELERLKAQLMLIPTALEEAIIKRPFNWQVEFPHVFDPRLPVDQRGFTSIIGNPPYFSVDATFGKGASELLWFKTIYADIYTDKTDILFYFLRWGYELLKQAGTLSFIVSRAFIQGDKSENLRNFLSRNTTITHILDFLGHKVFKAGIATCIIQYRKETPDIESSFITDYVLDFDKAKSAIPKKLELSAQNGFAKVEVNQENLKADRWEISPYSHIFDEIDHKGQKLELSNYGKFIKGIDTGLDEVFEGDFSRKFPKEFLRSRVSISSIHSFGHKPSETQIIYYGRDTQWEDIPKILQNHLKSHRNSLEARKVFKSGGYEWFHLHRPRVGLFEPKIFFPRRANANKFAVDEDGSLGFKSDVAGFVKAKNASIDTLHYICALLNSKPLEFRYRALGGIGKLTGKGMFEYFENQVGNIPIPVFEEPENNSNFQELAQLSKEAHQIWRDRYSIITTYQAKLSAMPYTEVAATHYHSITGDYGADVEYESPNPNREGHLLSLKIEPTVDGYRLLGEITEDEDWKEGDREWVELVTVRIRNNFLRRYLLARLIYLIEFDQDFRRKQKLTRDINNLVNAAFEALKVYQYDHDRISNLRVLEVIEQRVQQEAGRSDLENIVLRQAEIQLSIDQIAYRLYGVSEYQEVIEQALKVTL